MNDVFALWVPGGMTLAALASARIPASSTSRASASSKSGNAVYWAHYWVVFVTLRMVVDPLLKPVLDFSLGVTFPVRTNRE